MVGRFRGEPDSVGVSEAGFCSLPGYYHAKLLFLLWLQLPQYQGARRLYQQFLRPYLAEHEEWVDARLATVQGLLVRPELVSMASSFRKSMKGAPVIGWFLQTPDEWDRPHTPENTRSPPGYMGSSLEKRTDKMLQALKGPKAWDRRRSNYPHLAGPLPIQLKSCKTAADQQLAACSPYARNLMSRVRCPTTKFFSTIDDHNWLERPRLALFLPVDPDTGRPDDMNVQDFITMLKQLQSRNTGSAPLKYFVMSSPASGCTSAPQFLMASPIASAAPTL
ncbi:hypothetical protein WJX84_000780 [Apatococcus fuscideae]|uniref:HVA22-like protein n=1 Tax=Apatococcus fuscideae TaxID=2026836 RepID=A0AAW1SU40_9CHLO